MELAMILKIRFTAYRNPKINIKMWVSKIFSWLGSI